MEVNFYNDKDQIAKKELSFIPTLNSLVDVFDSDIDDYVKYRITEIEYIIKGPYMGCNINLTKTRK